MERHLQGIFSICFRICEDTDDAHDLTQDVCIKVMEHLKDFKKEAEFKTWLYRIAYNESLYFLRSKREYVDLDTVEYSLGKEDICDIDAQNLESTVRSSLDKLSPIDKSIVLLFYYDDLKIREISEITQMNENTIKTRLARAKLFLQPLLETLGKHL